MDWNCPLCGWKRAMNGDCESITCPARWERTSDQIKHCGFGIGWHKALYPKMGGSN